MGKLPHALPLASRGTCVACGTEAPAWQPRYRFLVRCPVCGLLRMPDAVLTGASAELYDDTYYNEIHGDYLAGADDAAETFRSRLSWMAQWAAAGALLEVGCAFGLFLREAQERFAPCLGVDVAEHATRIGREDGQVDIRRGDFVGMEFAEAPFDVVCAWDTMEHFVDPAAALDAMWRLLRPGGMLFFTTVDTDSRLARFRGARWRMLHLPTHLFFWGRRTLDRFLRRGGFEPVAMESAPVFRSLRGTCAVLQAVAASPVLRVAGRAVPAVLPAPVVERVRGFVDLGDIVSVAARKVARP